MNSKHIYFWLASNNLLNKKKFKLYDNIPRPILLIWQGKLPIIKEKIYLLSVLKLTGWVSGKIDQKIINQVTRKQPELTHEITCLYQSLVNQAEAVTTLFSFQMQTNDETAKELSQYLAKVLLNCNSESSQFLLDKHYHQFWYDLASLKLSQINPSIVLW